MKTLMKIMGVLFVVSLAFTSCKKATIEQTEETISEATLQKIYDLGFGKTGVQKTDEGYLVEGDIIVTEEMLNSQPDRQLLRVGDEEQYRTTNTVTGLPRTITVRVSSSLPSSYITATNNAIARYNALGLRISFSRVTSGGNIIITAAPSGSTYLASAGFPSGGDPYTSIRVNRSYLDTWNANTVTSILAHEMGHCIGFRHTDYAQRQYSCGGSAVNEGQAGVGAILIPGTPSGPDPNSWMLACIGNGGNRPFNTNDRTALNYVY